VTKKIYFSDFRGEDDLLSFTWALEYMKENPGTTLVVEPGLYNLSSRRARNAVRQVMCGKFGQNPEPVMFSPEYKYDIGLDLSGHIGSRIEAHGATLFFNGFMEGISLRCCRDITICGFTIDHLRKPFSYGRIMAVKNGCAEIVMGDCFPINSASPMIRPLIYDEKEGRFTHFVNLSDVEVQQMHRLTCTGISEDDVGKLLYFRHTAHSRPAILLYGAENTVIKDVTIHSAPGMGITAQNSKDIRIERLRVVPSDGDHMSTNTDATHFASCRGLLRLDGCEFDGQGDDSINVHTYYYDIDEHEGNTVRLTVRSPDGPHARLADYPIVGDVMELTDASTLDPRDTFRVTSVTPGADIFSCTVTLDRPLPENTEGMYLADADAVPELEFVTCKARNHFARSILIKCRRALVENCTVTDCFLSPVKIAAESFWKEGISSEQVTVRRCRFENCSRFDPNGCGGVHVYMDCSDRSALSHGQVIVEDNVIKCPNAAHGIVVENAKEARISGNRILSRDEDVVIGDGVNLI